MILYWLTFHLRLGLSKQSINLASSISAGDQAVVEVNTNICERPIHPIRYCRYGDPSPYNVVNEFENLFILLCNGFVALSTAN